MTAFTSLITRTLTSLSDTDESTWTSAEIATYLNSGIKEYSAQFPRMIVDDTLAANSGAVTLPSDFLGLIDVEIDDDPIPPISAETQTGYLLTHTQDETTPSRITIQPPPADGTIITVTYHGRHDLITDTENVSGYSSTPSHHDPILILFAIWQATLRLQKAEEQNPTSSSSLLMSQYAQNARRAERSWSEAMARAVYSSQGSAEIVNWHAQSGARIY